MKRLVFAGIIVFGIITALKAQVDTLSIKLATYGTLSSHELNPLWSHANNWGLFDQYGKSNALVYGGIKHTFINKSNFTLSTGFGGVMNADIKRSFLHELYVKGEVWEIDYSMGMEAYSPITYDEKLTSGFFLMSSNVRPIPRITFGFNDYIPLGFTKNWLEIKGGISQGVLNDDRGEKSNSASNVLLHEKWAYARLGNVKLQPYAGIVHSALFGGTRPDGTKIPIDFWATFMAKGSAKLGGGEETNAAGAHMGLWDFGLYYKHELLDLQFYWQKPFADASGMKLWNGENKDYTIGILVYPKEMSWLKGISVEVIKHDVQSDYGIPDPLYPVDYNGHKEGSIIWKDDIEGDFDNFMYEVFGETRTGWTWPEVDRYMQVAMNEGYKFGGRDDYMNNGSYYTGWTYYGQSMGTSLYHTIETADKYNSGKINKHGKFINNRVNAIHLGAEGSITSSLSYLFKASYTINKGSYAEEFAYRYSWERTPNYFYEDSKKQYYTMFGAVWKLEAVPGLAVNGTLAYDFGDLYESFGFRLGIVYRPKFNL
ncbi:hypothetical protein [Carboxylicivirga sp. N1Y90]|uniref:hypothetical protein n=1 Tax=Carboxylicivirga fragile TaxID=3417571 RepID=UPI003D34F760|nr:hypothetical protein [Marinilabiliaceae bacterium N1Y90]